MNNDLAILLIPEPEVEEVGSVRCDVSQAPSGSLQSCWNYETGERYVLACLLCRVKTTMSSLEVEVLVTNGMKDALGDPVKEIKIGSTTIQLTEGGSGRRRSMSSDISDL